MYVSQELDQLNRLLRAIQASSQQNELHEQKFYDIRHQIEADYIANILIHADLNVPQLDREYIQKLHSGDIKWKNNKGRLVSLKADFDFDLLEKLGLLFFEYNWVYFVGNLRMDDNLHKTVKPIVKFVQKLQGLFYETYQTSNFLFEVDKQYIDGLLSKNYQFNSKSVKYKKKKDKYLFAIDFHRIEYKNLISQFYWKKLIQYELDDVIWHTYYALERILDYFWMPKIEIFTDEERKRFLEFCLINIERSSLIHLDFDEYQKIMAIGRDANSYFIQYSSKLDYDVKANKNIIVHEIKGIKLESILLENRENFKGCESDWDLLEWYNTPCSHTQLHFLDTITRQSFSYVINHNLYLDSFNLSLNEYTKDLIEKSKGNMIIRHYLLNIVNWNISNSTIYCLFLLSCNDLFVSGCINLIDKIKHSDTHLNKSISASLQVCIASTLAKVIVNSSLQILDYHGKYREKDLAKLICFLTKKVIIQNQKTIILN